MTLVFQLGATSSGFLFGTIQCTSALIAPIHAKFQFSENLKARVFTALSKKLCTFKMPAKRVRFREISSNFAIVVIVLSCTFHSHALRYWYAFKAKNSTISAQSRTTRAYRYVAMWHISTYLQADASSCIVQCAFSLKGPLDEQKSFAVEWCS